MCHMQYTLSHLNGKINAGSIKSKEFVQHDHTTELPALRQYKFHLMICN